MFNFPWSNFHELNLDWILSVVKEAKEIFVKGEGDIQHAVETADQALETAEQAAAGVIADGAVTIPKINSEVFSLLAYCVSGSVAPNFIPAGALVILRKSTIYNVSDGIYTATRNIPQAAIITAADLDQSATLYREGGMNYLLHNEEKLSGTIDLIKAGLVILVTGDEASASVPADGLVYVANNTHGLTEGFYFNSSGATFPTTGGTADSDSFTAVNNILNALQTAVSTLGSDDIANDSTVTGASVTDALDAVKNTLTQDESSLAYPISGDTNTTGAQINKGLFVRLSGNSNPSLPDGYYLVAENIGAGASYSTTNLQKLKKDSGNSNYGALSVLNEQILKRCSLSFGAYGSTGSIASGTTKSFTATFSKNVPYLQCILLGNVGAAQPLFVSCYPVNDTQWGINVYNAGTAADGGTLRVVLLSLVEDVTITISE